MCANDILLSSARPLCFCCVLVVPQLLGQLCGQFPAVIAYLQLLFHPSQLLVEGKLGVKHEYSGVLGPNMERELQAVGYYRFHLKCLSRM